MRIDFRIILCIGAVAYASGVWGAQPSLGDIATLRSELDDLRREYETRIAELEQRLAAAEHTARAANERAALAAGTAGPTGTAPALRGPDSGNRAFNPAIGIIFQGQAWDYGHDPDAHRIAGFPLGGDAGLVPEGLALGETELDFSASVDDKFRAWLTLPIVIEDGEAGVEIEEAWVETSALPAGLSLRFGRFFSDIGYQNNRHAHTWDFVDQPLAYQAFLGDQYLDDGVQVRWLAPTELYVELGAEVLRGARYPAGGADDSGFGTRALFARTGGDVGDSHSWLAGLSYLHAKSAGRASGDEDASLLFTGETDLAGAQLVWKWAPRGNWKQKNFVFQSEYLWRNENGAYLLPDQSNVSYDTDQGGWYFQAVYQPFPQWRFGGRFDLLWTDHPGAAFAGSELEPMGSDPKRYSVMVDWSNSEFSRLRLQYTRDESGVTADNQWGLQYIFSIGAHGAHTF